MNCERIALLLDAYADGELDAASTMQVDAHVSACPGVPLLWKATAS